VSGGLAITLLLKALVALGLVANTGRPPIIKADINPDRGYCFIEFGDVADCTACLQLDGIIYNGAQLKIKRPKDYVMPYGVSQPGNCLAGCGVRITLLID